MTERRDILQLSQDLFVKGSSVTYVHRNGQQIEIKVDGREFVIHEPSIEKAKELLDWITGHLCW